MGGICRSGLVSSRQEGRCNAGRGVAVRWGVAPDVYTQAVYTPSLQRWRDASRRGIDALGLDVVK